MDYLESQELVVKRVMRSGNAGSVYVPKEWIDQKVTVMPMSIKENILQITAPHLENIAGIYLYGSYARGEEIPDSDIDILIVTDRKIPLRKYAGIDMLVVKIDEIRDRIKKDPIGYYSIIKEAVPIMNEFLLNELKKVRLDHEGIRWYYETTESALSIVKGLLEMEGDLSGSIYSLILRLRGMYLIQCNLRNRKYSNMDLEDLVVRRGLKGERYRKMYAIYRAVRDNRRVPSYDISVDDVKALYDIAEGVLENDKKKEKGNKKHKIT
jgi:predicted nucleotidyltransferase